MVEPETPDAALWQTMAKNIVAGIRTIDTATPIMVGGDSWESVAKLSDIPVFTDPRIVYSFHEYPPFDTASFDNAVAFQASRGGVPIVWSEFGVMLQDSGGASTITQAYTQAARLTAATAIWLWQTPNEIYWYGSQYGTSYTVQLLSTDTQNVVKAQWAKNTCRPL